MKLSPPSKATLSKRGLTESQWYVIMEKQDYKCPICLREFSDKVKPCIDHYHSKLFNKVRGKRPRLTMEQKYSTVRGILCLHCNLVLLPKQMTTERALNVYKYLKAFDERHNND